MDFHDLTETVANPSDAAVDGLPLNLPPRWKVERWLGRGGQGTVWLAQDTELGGPVAIKILSDSGNAARLERLRREVRVGRRLRHPHLVEIYELIEGDGVFGVVMEYVPRGTVADGPLPLDEVLDIAGALLEVLAHLHERDIIHRDVKPSNVLIADDGTAKLADLGLVRPFEDDLSVTATDLQVGTPAYMSPEVLAGEAPGPAADLYALGVTLYRLLTGRNPYEGSSSVEIAHRQLAGRAPSVRRRRPDCPRWLAAFVARLLEPRPENRWANAVEARVTFRRRRVGLSARRWRQLGVAAAMVISLTVLGGWLWSAWQPGDLAISRDDDGVTARSDSGRRLWRYESATDIVLEAAAGDLVGDRRNEVALIERDHSWDGPGTQLVVLDHRGSELLRSRLAERVCDSNFPSFSNRFSTRSLRICDLDGAGHDEMVWNLNHHLWYPGVVGWASVDGHELRERQFVNSGHIAHVEFGDADSDGLTEMVLAGVNNALGYQSIVAVVEIAGRQKGGGLSPDLRLWGAHQEIHWRDVSSYLVLGEQAEESAGLVVGPSGVTLRYGARERTIGGEEGLSGASADSLARFWDDLTRLRGDLRRGSGPIDERIDAFVGANGEWWRQAPYRASASLLIARALAAGGRPREGARVLGEALADGVDYRRIHRKRAEYLFIAGDSEAGREALTAAFALDGSGHSGSDAEFALAYDAAMRVDRDAWRQLEDEVRARGGGQHALVTSMFRLVWHFSTGEFERCSLDRFQDHGTGDPMWVLSLWARVERERIDQETVAVLERLAVRAEVKPLARAALARAALVQGDAPGAVELAERALNELEPRAATEWQDAAWLPLVRWAHATALDAAGNQREARPAYEQVASVAPNTFYGEHARGRAVELRRQAAGATSSPE